MTGARHCLRAAVAAVAVVVAAILTGPPATAREFNGQWGDLVVGLGVDAILEGRIAVTDDPVGWLDYGLGKSRFGGEPVDGSTVRAALTDASVILRPRVGSALTGHVHIRHEPDQRLPVDFVETFATWQPVSTSQWQPRVKAGLFFPPISLEHEGVGWTSPYSLGSSAINSWIGEEVRTVGVEAAITRRGFSSAFELLAAGFQGNDPTGTLLAYRGWSVGDRVSAFGDRLPLPAIPQLEPDGVFGPKHDLKVDPFTELDSRFGYYAGGAWRPDRAVEVRLLWYDNRADGTIFEDGQWPSDTRFISGGIKVPVPGVDGLEFLAQGMSGRTTTGALFPDGRYLIDVDFQSAYGLLSWRHGIHQVSGRLDWFRTADPNDWLPDTVDPNDEHGIGTMLGYAIRPWPGHRIGAEWQVIRSDREARALIDEPRRQTEHTVQIGYRIIF